VSPAKVPKQFQTAEQLGARFAIVFGDEWPSVAVKDLHSGEQKLVPHEQLLNNPEVMGALRNSAP
jgi:histidyl-tRNA synthetase